MRTGTIVAIGLVVVVVSIGGVGLLLGAEPVERVQSDQSEPTATEPQTASPEPTETRTPTDTPTPTPVQTATPTEPDEPQKASVNESDLVAAIETELIQSGFISQRSTTGNTPIQLRMMATNHSRDMAAQQTLAHNVGDGNSRERYERNGLFGQCEVSTENFIINARRDRLEVIGSANVDTHADGGFGTLEERLAETLVSDWSGDSTYNRRLSYDDASYFGVGVAVSDDNDVYATVNIC